MSRDLKTYKQLRAYLSGRLDLAEKEAFESELQTPEARDWLRVHGAIEEAGDQQYRDMFKSLHEEMKPKQERRRLLLWSTVSAAAIIALFFLIKGLMPSSPDTLYADNYKKPGASERVPKIENPVELMDSLEKKDTLTPLENRSLGIAYLETKQFEKAILSFGNISYETFIKDEALWFQALAALKLEKLVESVTYLEELLEEPDLEKSYFRPQAEKLCREIQELIQGRKDS